MTVRIDLTISDGTLVSGFAALGLHTGGTVTNIAAWDRAVDNERARQMWSMSRPEVPSCQGALMYPRTTKEQNLPARSYRYPHLDSDE